MRGDTDPRNQLARLAHRAEQDRARAWRRVAQAFISRLISGELVAYSQSDPPHGPWRAIPISSWRTARVVKITNIRLGEINIGTVRLPNVHVVEHLTRQAYQPTDWKPPGRPRLLYDEYMQEFRRRRTAELLCGSLNAESKSLHEFCCKIANPGEPVPSADTIKTHIRDLYNASGARRLRNPHPKTV
jgi:hypothetical protein